MSVETVSETVEFTCHDYKTRWTDTFTFGFEACGSPWRITLSHSTHALSAPEQRSAPEADAHQDMITRRAGLEQPTSSDFLSVFISCEEESLVRASFILFIKNFGELRDHEVLKSIQPMNLSFGQPGFGSTCFIPLPVLCSPEETFLLESEHIVVGATIMKHDSHIDDPVLSLSTNLRILIVEDSTFQSKMISRKLERCIDRNVWNIVGTVDSAEAALTFLSFDRYIADSEKGILEANSTDHPTVHDKGVDVIIIDHNLTGSGGHMSGSELVRKIRTVAAFYDIVLVGCSASIEKHALSFITAGCDAVWPKPLPKAEELVEYIYTSLSFRRELSTAGLLSPSRSVSSKSVNKDYRIEEIGDRTDLDIGGCNESMNVSDQGNLTGSSKTISHYNIIEPALKSSVISAGSLSADSLIYRHHLFAVSEPDVILLCEGGIRIPSHRLILLSASDFFTEVLCPSEQQTDSAVSSLSSSARILEVTISDCCVQVMHEILRFLYTGILRETALRTLRTPILEAATRLKLTGILEKYSDRQREEQQQHDKRKR